MAEEHEIVIIGGGPAGLTAGIYAARARRKDGEARPLAATTGR